MKGRNFVSGLLSILVLTWDGMVFAADVVPEPDGFRTENYRASIPATLKGATVISTEEASALWREKGALFVDVLPHDPKPAKLPAGTIWKEKIREDIPGSVWLANVGYGILNKETESYFEEGLRSHAGDDKNTKIVFYCMNNCWMSWNAAKRAVAWGYTSVLWYPLGTDGWTEAGLPTTRNVPFEF
ncbi:PQQ-dependent catabolism-associated CXXCW motif protein [Sinorhizobium sp. BG8]|uniref:PQQ-dependent catabolism-associated CXXCW motif protein n=1 Tax=Sinorhizobium sp. BG8 TaxID=2613773 RepID=UPI00193DD823|nr:PQQ-dependent catabolism-associated CXXCW motif protein [Sinorhizobium sp. BG8]QRM57548.1 PQQ-dependent catabolism-associated CXXCW motif protein [Sinorhizobium sp. BG8]